MSGQIKYCTNQLIRFSLMFKTGATDSAERTIQFGYTLGRLVVLFKNNGKSNKIISKFNHYNIGMAAFVLKKGLNETDNFEYTMIDYGFALGFMQEFLNHDHELWWKPVLGNV